MATLQIRLDDSLKKQSDELFAGLGLDTPTAVRIFLKASQENNGFPFSVAHSRTCGMDDPYRDARLLRNLSGPYSSGREAIAAMLED